MFYVRINQVKYKLYLLIFWLAFAAIPWSGALAADMVSVSVENREETITIAVPAASPHKVFTVENPDRLVVDVPSVGGHPKVALADSYDGDLLKKLRYGQFNPETSRFVFDLNQPVRVTGAHNENARKGDLLIITIVASSKIPPPSRGEVRRGANKMAANDNAPSLTLPLKGESKSRRHVAKIPKKPVIIIDAGHGGVDPGTIGPDGTQEKDVVLNFAKALKARLLRSGHYDVKLTRDDDTFIMLRKRVEIARKEHGNMFISLHADSAPEEDARGLSVYTVSEQASDTEAEALAARENKADVLSGVDLKGERQDVAGILISLAERDTKNRSATLADLLVVSLDDKVTLLPNSHRFAGFAVLKAPDIPSVLIETGFLSNPREEKLLNTKSYRDKVVGGIATGIDAYFKQEKQGGD